MKFAKPGAVRPMPKKKVGGPPKPKAMKTAQRKKIAALRSGYQTNG